MKFPLIPTLRFRSIHTISPRWLQEQGITLLLADLDNTIVPYSVKTPGEETRRWLSDLQACGVTLFILSNSRKPGRAQRFAEELGVPYQGHAGKPKRRGFLLAMERMGRSPEETAMVGDQIFTDIWGGNHAGIAAYLVKPIAFGNLFRVLRYVGETPFRLAAKRGDA